MQCQRLWNHWCNPSVKWLIRLLCVGSSLISSVGGQSFLGSFGAAETGFLAADYQNCFHIHSEDDTPSFQSNVQHKGLLSEYICMSSPSFMFPVNPQPQTENRENCTALIFQLPGLWLSPSPPCHLSWPWLGNRKKTSTCPAKKIMKYSCYDSWKLDHLISWHKSSPHFRLKSLGLPD